MSGWKQHHSHPNNNKSQIIYKTNNFCGTFSESQGHRKITDSENKEKTAPQREWWKGSLQSGMSKVFGDDGILRYLDCGEGFTTI